MARSVWKYPYVKTNVFKELYGRIKSNTKTKPIFVKSRSFVIYPIFVGYIFSVYNGKKFINILSQPQIYYYSFRFISSSSSSSLLKYMF